MMVLHAQPLGGELVTVTSCNLSPTAKKKKIKSITGYPVIFPRYKEVANVFLPQCDWAIKVTEKLALLTWNVSSALEESIRGVGHSKHFVVTITKVFQSC